MAAAHLQRSADTLILGINAFARTHVETITQRVSLLRELLAGVAEIGELCCDDRSAPVTCAVENPYSGPGSR